MSHRELMEWYRLERDYDIRRSETVAHMDDGIRPVTFKEFLIRLGRENRCAELV